MDKRSKTLPMILHTPSIRVTEDRLGQVRQMFHRTLATWASDVLLLRQARLHQMRWQQRPVTPWYGVHSKAA